MTFEFDKTYFTSVEVIIKIDGKEVPQISTALMQNGSVMGYVAEEAAAHNLSERYIHNPGPEKDFDSRDPDGKPLESKTLTKNGVNLGPSSFYGAGRAYNQEVWTAKAASKDYVITDTSTCSEDNTIRWTLKRGDDIAKGPHHFSKKKAETLFND